MIRNIILTLLLASLSTGVSAQSAVAKSNLKQMEWLLGTWTRTNTKPGRTASEVWVKASDTQWNGRGVNLKGTDTTFVEKLRIVIENDKLFYVADVPENKKLVYFEITSVSPDNFTCENPQHDFPKKIAYRRTASGMTAAISGDGRVVEYFFAK